jgi:hypothetical protein
MPVSCTGQPSIVSHCMWEIRNTNNLLKRCLSASFLHSISNYHFSNKICIHLWTSRTSLWSTRDAIHKCPELYFLHVQETKPSKIIELHQSLDSRALTVSRMREEATVHHAMSCANGRRRSALLQSLPWALPLPAWPSPLQSASHAQRRCWSLGSPSWSSRGWAPHPCPCGAPMR